MKKVKAKNRYFLATFEKRDESDFTEFELELAEEELKSKRKEEAEKELKSKRKEGGDVKLSLVSKSLLEIKKAFKVSATLVVIDKEEGKIFSKYNNSKILTRLIKKFPEFKIANFNELILQV